MIMEPGEHRRYENAPELFFMEQNLFRPMYRKWPKPVNDISITSLKDPRQELSFVAREIVRLVRTKGCRYRDFAVVTGDVPQYANYVPETFAPVSYTHLDVYKRQGEAGAGLYQGKAFLPQAWGKCLLWTELVRRKKRPAVSQ